MKKWVLSRRDSAEMVEKIESSLGKALNLPKSAQAECAEPEEGVVFVNLDSFTFVKAGDRFVPFLGSPKILEMFPTAVVDEGAIRFLLNGADVMRPGIKRLDEWGASGAVVVVKEERKGRAIAIGLSTVSSSEASAMTKGSCLKNLHHVGDRYWSLHKTV
ncbi:MAG: PUA domain-containing protein [Nitrososphaerales archaeon]|jgi:PUA domain protein